MLQDIVITGNTKTDLSLVQRVIGLAPGDTLSLEDFDGVWDRLEDCGYFAFVDLDTDEDDAGSRHPAGDRSRRRRPPASPPICATIAATSTCWAPP